MSSPNGSSSVNRASPVHASTSVQSWSVNRPSAVPEHPKKQKITISLHNKLPVRQGPSPAGPHGGPSESPGKPAPCATVSTPAVQPTSNAASAVPKPVAPAEACSAPMVNGTAKLSPKLSPGVLVPYGAESSEESDEEPKGLRREHGLGARLPENCPPARAEAGSSPACQQEPVHGAKGADSEATESGPSVDGASCQVAPAVPSESSFAKANGLPGKVSGSRQAGGLVGLARCGGMSWQPALLCLCFYCS